MWSGGRVPKALEWRRRRRRRGWSLGRGYPPPQWGWGLERGLCPLPRKILAFSPSKWCILMHSGAHFRPTRPITAIIMFMTFLCRLFWGGFNPRNPPLNTGLVTTLLRCSEILNDRFIANLLEGVPVKKKIWKSVNIWYNYDKNSVAYFFGSQFSYFFAIISFVLVSLMFLYSLVSILFLRFCFLALFFLCRLNGIVYRHFFRRVCINIRSWAFLSLSATSAAPTRFLWCSHLSSFHVVTVVLISLPGFTCLCSCQLTFFILTIRAIHHSF